MERSPAECWASNDYSSIRKDGAFSILRELKKIGRPESRPSALTMLLIDPDMDGTFTVSDKYKNMDPIDFIMNYYKCNKIDYTYEDVDGLLNDIRFYAEEHFEAMGFDLPDDL